MSSSSISVRGLDIIYIGRSLLPSPLAAGEEIVTPLVLSIYDDLI